MGKRPNAKWSVIDRWPEWPGFIDAMVECTKAGLEKVPIEGNSSNFMLFL